SAKVPARPPGRPWDPASCAEFVPHAKAYVRHESDLGQRLVGTWLHSQFFPVSRLVTLHFVPGGGGSCLDMTKVHPEFEFRWRINENGNLFLEAEQRFVATTGLPQLFDPNGIRFELVTYTEPFGKPGNYLLLAAGPDQDALAFHGAEPSSSASDTSSPVS